LGEKKTKSEYEDTYIAGRSTSILTHLEGGKRKDKKDMEKKKFQKDMSTRTHR
jgi:hypothetical protein